MKKVVLVLGMHRSGTSAITKSLEVLGVSLGDNLIPAANDNKKGFWEDKSVISLNDRLFALAGMTWSSLTEFPLELLDFPDAKKLEDEAVDLIVAAMVDRDVWGFKDPRCASLLPFWQRVLARAKVVVTYLFAVRNPLDIIASLKLRNQFTSQRTQQLWLLHTFNNLRLLAKECVSFVAFEQLIKNPAAEISRIADELGLSVDDALLEEFANNYIDPALCSDLQSQDALLSEASIFPFVQEVYLRLNDVAIGNVGFLELLAQEPELRPHYIKTLHGTLNEFCLHADIRDHDVNNFVTILEKHTQTISLQQQFVESLRSEVTSLQSQLSACINRHDELFAHHNSVSETLMHNSDEFKKHHDEVVGELLSQISNLERAKDDAEATMLSQTFMLEQVREELQLIKASTSWRVTMPLRRFIHLFLNLKMK